MNATACARCGQPITPGARFCTRCGSDVSGEQGNVATARMPSIPPEENGLDILRRATLGEYEILTELGRGGMATVYLAHEISLDRKVAIKVMAPQLMFGEGMSERFRREARTAASLSHPHIIPIYTVKEAGRVLYFVMKFVSGRPLDDIVREVGPLPIPMAQAILSQVGGALGYAHRRGIIHRDIKPANIMIDDEGWAVVTDFGIAKVAETQGLTMTGVAVGTPSYMSPEQCAAKEVTGRSDQYSLGVVAYEMITGRQPFVADTAMAIMWQHFNDPPRPIREIRPDCPPALESAVLRMLEKQPDKRWPSIEDAMGVIGANPLAHDDPIRLRMVALAKSSLNQRLLDEMKTPTSLVPPTRASDKQVTEVLAAVDSVALSPRSANLVAGDTLQLSVVMQDLRGTTIAGRTIAWISSDYSVATVSDGGLVIARTPGDVTISAKCEGKTGTSHLTIAPTPVAVVQLAPLSGSLEVEGTLQLTATLKDAQGSVITGRPITWSSSAPALAGVSPAGLVAGAIAGTAKISASCEGKSATATITVTDVPVASLELSPGSHALHPGDKVQLTAVVKGPSGKVITGRSLTWASRDPTVASISSTGALAAIKVGTVQISASCEGKTGKAEVVVTPVPVANVTIAPPGKPLQVGETLTLIVMVRDAAGNALERSVAWDSSNPALLKVSSTGELTALRDGKAEVVASVEGKRGTLTVSVLPTPVAAVVLSPASVSLKIGETSQLTVQARDARGKSLEGRAATWSSSKPAAAMVSPSGLVTAVTTGNSIISVTIEGKKATSDVAVAARVVVPASPPTPENATVKMEGVTVAPLPVRAEPVSVRPEPVPVRLEPVVTERPASSKLPMVVGLVVVALIAGLAIWRFGSAKKTPSGSAVTLAPSPATPSLKVGDSVLMSVAFRDSANHEVQDTRPVIWSSDNPSVAVISGQWVRAVGGGNATIIADAGGLRGTATVIVTGATAADHVAVGSIVIARIPDKLPAGEVLPLTVAIKDERGNVLQGRPMIWTSSNAAVAEVSPVGVLVTKTEGTATITASSEGKSATFSVAVTPVNVASVSVTPSRSSIEVGGNVKLDVLVRDAKGNALLGRSVEWTSSDGSVASVGGDGTVKGGAVGTATITATADGKRGTATVTIVTTRVEVATVTVAPATAQLSVGETLQLGATLKDTRNALVRDRTPGWTSSDPSVATVSPSGMVSAIGAGTATIIASTENKRASARMEVVRSPVATVSLTAPSSSLPVGETYQLLASIRDARGNIAQDRSVSWTSSNPQVATVGPAGVVTAVGQGTARITATSEAKSGSVTFTVPKPAATVAAVSIAPASAPLEAGGTVQLSATPQDAHGAPISRPVSWSSSSSSVATVSPTGLVTAIAPGTASITASSDGRSTTAAVTVTAKAGADVSTNNPPTGGGGGAIARLAISAGGNHTCGLLSGGALVCWGAGQTTPSVMTEDIRFSRLSSGFAHSCGLTAGGEAWCWGANAKGQLGDGSTNNTRARPVAVTGGLSFRLIRAGGTHSCGLTGAGKAYCWGENGSGQLGDGSTSGHTRPVPIPDLTFTDLAAGNNFTCGIASTGKTYCWGDGFSGQLGYGQLSTESSPIEVNTDVKFAKIFAGGTHACALTAAGKAYCWGDNRAGQVGDGTTSDRTRPVEVQGGSQFEELSLGSAHSCGRTSGGMIDCWGANGKGQLGDGTRGNRGKPVKIAGDGPFVSISAGGTHTCAATATQAFCWGENARGQLGDGSLVAKPSPVAVLAAGNQ